jgi:hypothetical protein
VLNNALNFSKLGVRCIDLTGKDDLKNIHQFVFKVPSKSSEIKYTIEFYEYKHEMFVGKFYPTQYSKEKYRFGLIVDEGVSFANKVISTVLKTFQWMSERYPNSSFGFIGEPKYKKDIIKKKSYTVIQEQKESIVETKRFQWYYKVCNFVVNPDEFEMYISKSNSSILLINKRAIKSEFYSDYVKKIEAMMIDNYPEYVSTYSE